jgi:hypothetical protein
MPVVSDIEEMIRAAAGRAAPLGEVRARGLARAAIARAKARRPRRGWAWMGAVVALLVLIAVGLRLGRDELPARLRARSAGRLVPGPFPPTQTAAQRLDRVAADRLIALREARCRSVARGGR